MPVSTPRPDEQQRLAALQRYDLLDPRSEESFDRLTRLAARLFEVPLALITLVLEDRQWNKSCVGTDIRAMDIREVDRHLSFCTHNIEADGVMVVEDAWQDARFDDNPLVHEDPQVRFYAGAPLTTHDGHRLGSLCLHDFEPRTLDAEEEKLLEDLAAEVMDEIELRLALPKGGEALYADKALLASVIRVQNEVAGASLSPQETTELIVRRAQAITGADGAWLFERDGNDGLRGRASYGATGYDEAHCYEEKGRYHAALEGKETLVVPDVREDPRARRRAPDVRSSVLVPLRAGGGRVAGGLEVVARAPHAFAEKHAQALEVLAGPIEAALVRARASQALGESTRRYRSLMDHLPVGVYRSTPDGRIIEANAAMANLLGYDSVEALLQQRVSDLYLHDEDRVRHHRQLDSERTKPAEFPLRRADGDVVWVRDFPKAVSQGEGDAITHFDGVLVDITERKEAEEQLIEAKEEAEEMARLKSTFLANMSHEIRTPLSSVLGFADVLAEEVEGQKREFAKLIRKSGERLSETLNSVLDLARLESGGFEASLEAVSARSVLQETAELFAPMVEDNDLSFELDLPDDEDLVFWADRAGVGRILANLLSNAVKFTEEGAVSVKAHRAEGSVQVVVSDTGVGMEEAFLEHLFDEFRQESSGLDRRHEGAGLGLAITQRLVDVMGAEIEVESEKGWGSTFTLSFRSVEEEAPRDVVEADSASTTHQSEGGRVLIVEDDGDARRLLDHLLRAPWHATIVASVPAFLEAAAAGDYDAVIVDIDLGDHLDGKKVIERLREEDRRYAVVPAVALTGYAMPGDEEHFLEAGFDHYLAKPFTRQDLYCALDDAVVQRARAAETGGEPRTSDSID